MRIHRPLFASALAVISVSAAASTSEELSMPTPLEFGDVRAKTDAMVDQIVSGNFEQVARDFAEENPLLEGPKVQSLINQYRNAVDLYGPATKCEPWRQDYKSSLRINTEYVCQHRNLLIRLSFRTDRLDRGWTTTSMSFNDDF